MIKTFTLFLFVVSFSVPVYAQRTIPAGAIVESILCKADPTQSYALYIPVTDNKRPLPIIYLFDPHGAGFLPVRKYKKLADTYGFILAGSNMSKNGNDWGGSDVICRRLLEDTKARLNIDEGRMYSCGFSGGAKVASYMAIRHHDIKGVIAGGAALPDGVSAGDFTFSFTALTGEGDMNLTELIGIDRDLNGTRTRHRIIIFDGKHEWAPEAVMSQAFAGLQLDAMRDGDLTRDNTFIKAYIAKSKARLKTLTGTGQYIKAMRECSFSIPLVDGLSAEVSWFRQQAAAIAANPRYKTEQERQEGMLAREQNIKEGYMQHFQQQDKPFWNATIKEVQGKAAKISPEQAMYQRLQAYLSLAFYSFSNRLISKNQNTDARYFVDLYKTVDPANGEAWFFSALLDARENNATATETDLVKAVTNGFRDRQRLSRQPEFKALGLNLANIEARIH